MRDAVALTRLGTPNVVLVHEPFAYQAKVQAKQLGMPDLAILVYPQDMPAMDSQEKVTQKAHEVLERIPGMLIRRSL